jgi:hypothetical protein
MPQKFHVLIKLNVKHCFLFNTLVSVSTALIHVLSIVFSINTEGALMETGFELECPKCHPTCTQMIIRQEISYSPLLDRHLSKT